MNIIFKTEHSVHNKVNIIQTIQRRIRNFNNLLEHDTALYHKQNKVETKCIIINVSETITNNSTFKLKSNNVKVFSYIFNNSLHFKNETYTNYHIND